MSVPPEVAEVAEDRHVTSFDLQVAVFVGADADALLGKKLGSPIVADLDVDDDACGHLPRKRARVNRKY